MEKAFEKCRCKADWCRMGSVKNFKSKVDWAAAARIDPQQQEGVRLRVRAVEDEVRGEMEREALLLKAQNKLAAVETPDPLNH